MHSFRSFIRLLEEKGELLKVKEEVNPKYEVTSILWKNEKSGKATLFEKVKGKNIPLIGGLYLNPNRIGLALNLQMEEEDKKSVYRKLDKLIRSAILKPKPCINVKSGPVKEEIKKGKDVDLRNLPIPTFFRGDKSPYITAGVCIAKNPETETLNLGLYRVQVRGKNKIVVYGSPESDLSTIYSIAERKGYNHLDLAIAIGVEPSILISAISKIPKNVSELEVAGVLKGEPIRLVECETVNLKIPYDAEIVLEGKVKLKEKVEEGPFGEFSGYYSSSLSPLTIVTAISHRSNPFFHAVLPGPSKEHFTLMGLINIRLEQKIFTSLKSRFKGIRKLNLLWSFETGNSMSLFISLRKQNEEEPKRILKEVFRLKVGGKPVSNFVKRVVVVDEDVDVYSLSDVEWAVSSRLLDKSQIYILPKVKGWSFERGVGLRKTSIRIGFDATKPLEEKEKFRRVKLPKV